MRAIKNILELRQFLSERLPNVRLYTEDALRRSTACWPTGLPELDRLLGGGVPKSAVTELVSAQFSSGSALVLWTLLRQAHERGQWVALVDAHDSFDAAFFGSEIFPRCLWARCRDGAQALKATDLLLRDGNLSLVLLDLRMNPPVACRRISATIWHRFRRIVQPLSTALVVVAPEPMVSSAHVRLRLQNQFPLDALDHQEADLLHTIETHLTAEKSDTIEERELAEAI